jgi:hypothetical protein
MFDIAVSIATTASGLKIHTFWFLEAPRRFGRGASLVHWIVDLGYKMNNKKKSNILSLLSAVV